MEIKEIKIEVPEGYEIDKENSSLAEGKIVFKKKKSPFHAYDGSYPIEGYYITPDSVIRSYPSWENNYDNRNVFTTEKLAKKALAMAQLSQIIEHDEVLKNYRFTTVNPAVVQDVCIIIYNVIDRVFGIHKYLMKREDALCFRADFNFLTFKLPIDIDSQHQIKDVIMMRLIRENRELLKDYFMVND